MWVHTHTHTHCTALIYNEHVHMQKSVFFIIYVVKMEPWVESHREKPRGDSDLQEEPKPQQESPRKISDLLKTL